MRIFNADQNISITNHHSFFGFNVSVISDQKLESIRLWKFEDMIFVLRKCSG